MFLENLFPVLRPSLPLPQDVSEQYLFLWLLKLHVNDAPREEIENYCRSDFRRFLYTWGLTKSLSGKCLELGSNPYFTTMLIKEFTSIDLTLANYFGPNFGEKGQQIISIIDFNSGTTKELIIDFYHFNIEEDKFPFLDDSFDVLLFCEIIEHLTMDPIKVFREIKRVLKPNGFLILTTPNVARLENVCRLVSGTNIYDPYSGYGPYGRHNREYNKHELYLLLTYLGFDIETMFTADVHTNHAGQYANLKKIKELVDYRINDLGQYIFLKARSVNKGRNKRPDFLYRSYPPNELESI